jgi:flavin reductase (DIM6/NTAB) family NADH-FMN oxidoreductase RutF
VSALGALLDRLDTVGCVVTTAHGDRIAGCYVSYLTACSMEPVRLAVFTSVENLTHELVAESGVLAVHPVARGQQAWVERFGLRSGRDVDKFAGLPWHPGETGSPILEDALGWLEGRVLESHPCGDHTLRLVEPVAAELRDARALPLRASEVYAAGIVPPHDRALLPWPHRGVGR